MTQDFSQVSILQGIKDQYNGITVESSKEYCEVECFTKRLKASMEYWELNQYRTVWFKVDLHHSDWIPVLVKNGFKYHHAKEDYVTLLKWLSTSEEYNVPSFAHTLIGVGAIVVNSSDELLVVTEKYYSSLRWKLPGGYVDPGEDIVEAAIREVKEETNIKTEFVSLISLRQTHNANFGCSDLYIIVNLKAISNDVRKQSQEIMACEWMKIENFLQDPNVHETNKFFVKKFLEYQQNNLRISFDKNFNHLTKKLQTVFSIDDKQEK